jgi:hypothetical protein
LAPLLPCVGRQLIITWPLPRLGLPASEQWLFRIAEQKSVLGNCIHFVAGRFPASLGSNARTNN